MKGTSNRTWLHNHAHIVTHHPNSPNTSSLLSIDDLTEEEWFARFNTIESQLTKLFVLIALLRSQGLITQKECAQFKEFIMRNEETASHSVSTFDKSKSLYSMRNELRGRLGLPRQRKSDYSPTSDKSRTDLSFDKFDRARKGKARGTDFFSLHDREEDKSDPGFGESNCGEMSPHSECKSEKKARIGRYDFLYPKSVPMSRNVLSGRQTGILSMQHYKADINSGGI